MWRYVLFFLSVFIVLFFSQKASLFIAYALSLKEKNWERDKKWIAAYALVGSVVLATLAIMGRFFG
jgi:hypothetical protein